MPQYPLSQLLSKRQAAFGLIVPYDAPELVEIAGAIGFDFIMIDGEHGPIDAGVALQLIRACEPAGMAPLVRVGSHLAHEVLKFLDVGAAGILFPRVESRQDAEHVVATVRFPPAGKRGVAPGVRAARYGGGNLAHYLQDANRELLVLPIIETASGVEAIDEILSVDGIDVLTLGPVDLSASMGFAGDVTVPEVKSAVSRVAKQCQSRGKPLLLAASSLPQVQQALAVGATMVMIPFSTWIINFGRQFLEAAREGIRA